MLSRPRLVVAALLLAGVAGCTGHSAVSQDVSNAVDHQVVDDVATHYVSVGDRQVVEGVTGSLLDGTSFDLSSWRGHFVVVNFWGSWCYPCRDEAQALEQVYRDNKAQGVEFLGIDIRDDRAQAQTFLRDHHVTYPTVFDESNLLALRFRGVPPTATPTTVVLDSQGRIAARHSGAILYTQLRAMVDHVMNENT